MQCINTAVVNSNFRKKTTLSYILKVMFVVILSEPITWPRSWMVKFIELANICYVLWSCGVVEFHYYIPYPSLPFPSSPQSASLQTSGADTAARLASLCSEGKISNPSHQLTTYNLPAITPFQRFYIKI